MPRLSKSKRYWIGWLSLSILYLRCPRCLWGIAFGLLYALSILYLRCSFYVNGKAAGPQPAFNSLFEMRGYDSVAAAQQEEGFQFSIWDAACYGTNPGGQRRDFQFSIWDVRENKVLTAPTPDSFNSLFEMRILVGRRVKRSRLFTLSILYLRCEALRATGIPLDPQPNALSILYLRCPS